MVNLMLGLLGPAEDRLLAEAIEHGHTILARMSTAREIVQALESNAGGANSSDAARQQRQQQPGAAQSNSAPLGSLSGAPAKPPSRAAIASPDAVIVSATRMTLSVDLLELCDRLGIRLIALASSAAERHHAAAIGLLDVIDSAAEWPHIEAALGTAASVPARVVVDDLAPRARRASTVIAVWGPSGAPGRTTLAVNIAAEIAASGHTVVLADADSYGGTVAPVLGMLDESPGFAAACRLSASESLSRRELERIAQRYNSPQGAFWVLTGIGRAARWPELGAEKVQRTLTACREWAEYVVVDTGFCLESDEGITSDLFAPRRNAATLAALGAADHVVAVGLADPVGMSRFLRAWAELAEIVSTTRLSVVMNRVRASAVGLDPQGQVRQTLLRFGGIEHVTLVPHDLNGLDSAVLEGRTLRDAAPRSAARLAVQRLVLEQLVPVQTETQRRGIRWPRASRRSARAAGVQSERDATRGRGQAEEILTAR